MKTETEASKTIILTTVVAIFSSIVLGISAAPLLISMLVIIGILSIFAVVQ